MKRLAVRMNQNAVLGALQKKVRACRPQALTHGLSCAGLQVEKSNFAEAFFQRIKGNVDLLDQFSTNVVNGVVTGPTASSTYAAGKQ